MGGAAHRVRDRTRECSSATGRIVGEGDVTVASGSDGRMAEPASGERLGDGAFELGNVIETALARALLLTAEGKTVGAGGGDCAGVGGRAEGARARARVADKAPRR